LNNRSGYSEIRTLKFTTDDVPFIITGNPVTNDMLIIQINRAAGLALYTADGKLLWQQEVNAGTKIFDVSRYAKGTYFIKGDFATEKVVIQ
jgi:hypothetical protein